MVRHATSRRSSDAKSDDPQLPEGFYYGKFTGPKIANSESSEDDSIRVKKHPFPTHPYMSEGVDYWMKFFTEQAMIDAKLWTLTNDVELRDRWFNPRDALHVCGVNMVVMVVIDYMRNSGGTLARPVIFLLCLAFILVVFFSHVGWFTPPPPDNEQKYSDAAFYRTCVDIHILCNAVERGHVMREWEVKDVFALDAETVQRQQAIDHQIPWNWVAQGTRWEDPEDEDDEVDEVDDLVDGGRMF